MSQAVKKSRRRKYKCRVSRQCERAHEPEVIFECGVGVVMLKSSSVLTLLVEEGVHHV